jgi:hypothetical protein
MYKYAYRKMLMIIFHIIIIICMNCRLPSCDILLQYNGLSYGKLSKDDLNILKPMLGRPFCYKVRTPILLGYASYYIVYYKDIGEFQILYLKIYVGKIGAYPR